MMPRRRSKVDARMGVLLAAVILGAVGATYAYVAFVSSRTSVPFSMVLLFDPQIAANHVEIYSKVSYSLSVTANVMTAGAFGNTSHLIILELDRMAEAPRTNSSFLVIRGPEGWPLESGIYVIGENSTVVVAGRSEEDLAKAFDRLLLCLTGKYAIDVDPNGQYLVVEVPGKGHKVGIPWLSGRRLDEVLRVPVFGGTDQDVARILLDGLMVSG